jgi:hypothetical protein
LEVSSVPSAVFEELWHASMKNLKSVWLFDRICWEEGNATAPHSLTHALHSFITQPNPRPRACFCATIWL